MANSDVTEDQSIEDPNEVIQGLWIGPELSIMEQLSIASFLGNGHEYHLYVYNQPKHIPDGTVVRNAAEILPSSRIFQYRQYPSYAGFANFFRYKLLVERGGWWVDTDTICLKHFDFPEEYVFSTELVDGIAVVNCGAIKVPRGSETMAYAWEVCQAKHPEQLVWGETGPRLMSTAVKKYGLEKYSKPPQVFCPVSYDKWHRVLDANAKILGDDASYAIHLWNEMWRKVSQDKNARYHDGCLYEQLKSKYLRIQT